MFQSVLNFYTSFHSLCLFISVSLCVSLRLCVLLSLLLCLFVCLSISLLFFSILLYVLLSRHIKKQSFQKPYLKLFYEYPLIIMLLAPIDIIYRISQNKKQYSNKIFSKFFQSYIFPHNIKQRLTFSKKVFFFYFSLAMSTVIFAQLYSSIYFLKHPTLCCIVLYF